jgi:hypothetical protein
MHLLSKCLREQLLVMSSVISAAKRCNVVGAVPNPVSTDLSSSTMQLRHFIQHLAGVLLVVEMTPARTNALRSPNRLALMEASEVADSSVMQAGALI